MPRFAANLSMLFSPLSLLDRMDAAAKAGFKAVEYLFPYDVDAGALKERLEANGLEQVLFNLPAGDWATGERGIACHPDRVDEFRAGVDRAIGYAKTLGCPRLNCLAGIVPPGREPAEARATFVANLGFAAKRLADSGLTLLIEAINTRDIPGFFLNTTGQGLGILEEVGTDNLKLQYDIYHMQIMEGDLAPTIEKHLDRIGHIQIADTPGRHEPGTGEINYPFLFGHLDRIGYAGWVGCEYVPSAPQNTEASLGWMRG